MDANSDEPDDSAVRKQPSPARPARCRKALLRNGFAIVYTKHP